MIRNFILVILLSFFSGELLAQDNDVEKIKSAYLLNFIAYTEWPVENFLQDKTPLVICIVNDEHLKKIMQDAIKVQSKIQRPLEIRSLSKKNSDLGQCNVIYVGEISLSFKKKIFEDIAGKPIVTIGEQENFLKEGGMISFIRSDETLQFRVNTSAAGKAGLKFSSRMLTLAQEVSTFADKDQK